jgi:GxxExxY protein
MDTNQTEIVYKDLSYRIVGLAMEAHNELGFGFLEKVYENALMILFRQAAIEAEHQKTISVFFRNQIVGEYCADIIVGNKILLEVKSVGTYCSSTSIANPELLKSNPLSLGPADKFR